MLPDDFSSSTVALAKSRYTSKYSEVRQANTVYSCSAPNNSHSRVFYYGLARQKRRKRSRLLLGKRHNGGFRALRPISFDGEGKVDSLERSRSAPDGIQNAINENTLRSHGPRLFTGTLRHSTNKSSNKVQTVTACHQHPGDIRPSRKPLVTGSTQYPKDCTAWTPSPRERFAHHQLLTSSLINALGQLAAFPQTVRYIMGAFHRNSLVIQAHLIS